MKKLIVAAAVAAASFAAQAKDIVETAVAAGQFTVWAAWAWATARPWPSKSVFDMPAWSSASRATPVVCHCAPTLQAIANVTSCGSFRNASALASASALQQFSRQLRCYA